ncbi:adventurous gliding motility lipoprotein CglB [Myxococcus sp. K15C18031901]|uniref:adventurous gliding motility lipoprotein CglB n=1 Tax=Myxococcus dinghuensis TaxID=2906761 RepID=UPI0020A7D2D5|nr:adventurous gliding motility lipoprotein CglB [Myxococcus dinghuensis]MCP3101226.1 adventurous gliding motility lipoprotein CglB [Myxococcus dinghuensis]
MRAKQILLSALALGAFTSVVMAGCQSYDFERVEPLAIAATLKAVEVKALASKPNAMLLVDVSGSMTGPVDPSRSSCMVTNNQGDTVLCRGENPCPTATCPTRWTELQAAVPQFLANSGAFVRYGLTTYPQATTGSGVGACFAPTEQSVRQPLPAEEDDASLVANAEAINQIIQGIPNFGTGQPLGGTPTSMSLAYVGNLASLQSDDRNDYVILLTDGLPNCNEFNPYSYDTDAANCRCTIENNGCTSSFLKRGCLDKTASVDAVTTLANKKITTIVIGFGAETAAGDGPDVLQAMAVAGGFQRKCTSPTSCGANDTCNLTTGLCNRQFFQAGNQAELSAALEQISKEIRNPEPCFVPLEPAEMPSDPKLILVYVEGEKLASGDNTWVLGAHSTLGSGVIFNGSTCERLKNSRPEAPVNVEVRAIRQQ